MRASSVPEYAVWCMMKQRCGNPRSAKYARYGARGIRVCERWVESFANFIADMGPRPSPDHSVDRINNDGNYEPGNCRWATRSEQGHNRNTSFVVRGLSPTFELTCEVRRHQGRSSVRCLTSQGGGRMSFVVRTPDEVTSAILREVPHLGKVHAERVAEALIDHARAEAETVAALRSDPYPTLHAIGLGPQLAELERICADAYRGKHAGENIVEWGATYHHGKALSHLDRGGFGERDADSGARHLIHAAARLLMAAACIDKEGL